MAASPDRLVANVFWTGAEDWYAGTDRGDGRSGLRRLLYAARTHRQGVAMQIVWREANDLKIWNGHGVNIFVGTGPVDASASTLIAVIDSLGWQPGRPGALEILIRKPGAGFDDEFLAAARSSIEAYVAHPQMLETGVPPLSALWAGVNT